MSILELVVAMLLLGAVLTPLARRIDAPYPALLAVAGAVLAFVPGVPALSIDPPIALALFVAPVLLEASYAISLRDLWHSRVAIAALIGALVVLTVAAVAVVARLLVPQMPWAAAVALGAIVAPPDASAAISVLRQVAPPYRLHVVLEGESLLNDALALLIYRLALGAAFGVPLTLGGAALTLAVSSAGGALLGGAIGWAYERLARRIGDVAVFVMTQFVAAFAVWMLAERLHLSAVIATVCFGLVLSERQGGNFDAEHRLASVAVWRVALFGLTALAFILVGLQLRQVLERGAGSETRLALFAGAVLATVIAVRFGWTLSYAAVARWWHGRPAAARGEADEPGEIPGPSLRGGLAVAWCGMRGVVTLAAALALPQGDGAAEAAFPYRDDVIAAAFAVVLGTLVLHGFTLAPLLRRLRLPEDRSVERELVRARAEAAAAALAVLDSEAQTEVGPFRAELEARASDRERARGDAAHRAAMKLRLRALAAQRGRLAELWRAHEIGDPAFRAAEEELDWTEGALRRQL